MVALALISVLGTLQATGQSNAPDGPYCFAMANSSSPLPLKDIEKLKETWDSKEITRFPSGNYGKFSNGCYYIVSKDLPLLKGLRDRFELSKKIVSLALDGRSKVAQTVIAGKEFSDDELTAFSKLIDKWTGMYFSNAELTQQDTFMFTFVNSISFTQGGESFTVRPTYKFPSEESFNFAKKNSFKPGVLVEESEKRRKENFARHAEGIGSDAPEGGFTLRMFNVMSERPDYFGCQRELLDVTEKIYQEEFRLDRAEIARISKPIREFQPFMFEDFELPGLSDANSAKNRSELVELMRRRGYSGEAAESRASKLTTISRDILITLRARIKSFGYEASEGAVNVKIWP